MATRNIYANNFQLTSTWIVKYGPDNSSPTGYDYRITSGPNTVEARIPFDLSSIPNGSTITAVNIYATLNSPATGAAIRDISMDSDPNWWPFDGSEPYLGTVKSLFDSGVREIGVWWRFKANGVANYPEGSRSSSLHFSGVTMSIEYTPPPSYSNCSAPTSASLSASVSEGNTSVSFSGATGGTNNQIMGYVVEYAESSNGSTWGAWGGRKTVNSTSGSGSFSVSPPTTRGYYRKFRVYTLGSAGPDYGSDWKEIPGTLRKNSLPAAPGVSIPYSGVRIYNPNPRLLVTVGSDADSHKQTVTCSGYTPSSAGQQAVGKKLVLRRSSALTVGTQNVSVISTDALGVAGSAVARSFNYVVPAFTDPTLTAGQTNIKAAHINELRAMVNDIRAYYGMAAYAWAQTVTAGSTSLAGWSSHIAELRQAIDQIVALVNGWDSANATHDISLPVWISITQNKPTVAVMNQLRSAIPLL